MTDAGGTGSEAFGLGKRIGQTKWEVAGRYSATDLDLDGPYDRRTEASLGVQRSFLRAGHALKVSGDLSHLTAHVDPEDTDGEWRLRLQGQIVF